MDIRISGGSLHSDLLYIGKVVAAMMMMEGIVTVVAFKTIIINSPWETGNRFAVFVVLPHDDADDGDVDDDDYVNPVAPPKVNPWALGGKFCHHH